jgi:hypothetical protein
MGIIVGQFNQGHPAFCYPQKLVDQMQTVDSDLRGHPGRFSDEAISNFVQRMRAAVAQYMLEHPKRLPEKTLQVIFAALLHAFPCPG